MRRHWNYLKYVLRHKWFVFVACRACGVGLFQALIHDWHKFLPSEWGPYARTFYKPDGSKQYVESIEFAQAWNLHQKRGKHHWQHWLLTWDRGNTDCLPMPEKYMREMVADWWGAGRAITGKWDARAWFEKNRDHIKLHPATLELTTRTLAASQTRLSPPVPFREWALRQDNMAWSGNAADLAKLHGDKQESK